MKSSKPISLLLLTLLIPSLLFQLSRSTTIVVDGVSEWKDPSVHVGDSVIFKHKYHYSLYIFQNQRAFNLCNFTQSTLLSKPNSTYTWHPSRAGMFYFTFSSNGTTRPECKIGTQKLAIEVSNSTMDEVEPSGAPSSYPWPMGPKEASSPMLPAKGGGIPFINSNPAVPLPTGEVDSATITALPISPAHYTHPVMIAMQMLAMICMAPLIL